MMQSKFIIAEEDDSVKIRGDDITPGNGHDVIPGPPASMMTRIVSRADLSQSATFRLSQSNNMKKGNGMLASPDDLNMSPEIFAQGCMLLQQAALGNQEAMEKILAKFPDLVNFRDYDRRTALHVASSEGNLDICKFLIKRGARANRSDRWGGSPLDDAHRHRQTPVIAYLRKLGASTGSTNNLTNFITAAAAGDVDEVNLLLSFGDVKIDEGDYDHRTALHLAAGEGHTEIVQLLCEKGANVNIVDRWGGRPLDDAKSSKQTECVNILKKFGAHGGKEDKAHIVDNSTTLKAEVANLEIDFHDLEMIDRIGKGAFGEIYKCKWRGTLVAAKCIQSSKIRKEWLKSQVMEQIKNGADVDEAIRELDEAEMTEHEKEEALEDFRQEIAVLKSLRHPNIVLLLAYSTTANTEVMVSELMKCSLLDIFKAHLIHGTRLKKKDQLMYATQLAQGMSYLHTCKPPIIHRDLKPANLLIDFSGNLKVADFGLATVRPNPKNGETDTFQMTGETGSYRFMAPEVFRHEEYTETVDIYSYAMILFHLLDGKPPWPHDNGLVAVRKAAHEGDRPPVPRSWDVRLQSLLQESWSESPKSRPSFDKILKLLNEYTRDVYHQDASTIHASSSDSSVFTCVKDLFCGCRKR